MEGCLLCQWAAWNCDFFTDDFSLHVSPATLTNGDGKFVFTTDQTATVTCEGRGGTDLVIISSCQPCHHNWTQSELGRGRAELLLAGGSVKGSFGDVGCQFSCWQYNSTCTLPPDHFTPSEWTCLSAVLEKRGRFVTINFKAMPEPQKFQCVLRNWKSLTCTWTLTSGSFWPINAHNVGLVSVSHPCHPSAVHGNCTNGVRSLFNISRPVTKSPNGRTISMDVTLGLTNITLFSNYSFHFVINTDFADVTQNYNVITDEKIVQYEAVSNLRVESDEDNPTVLVVLWTLPTPAQTWSTQPRVCRLRLEAVSAPWLKERNRTIEVSGNGSDGHNVTVTGLHPSVTYKVHVQFRHPDSMYWSDMASSSGTTSENVPSQAPQVTPGGFMRTSCDTGDCLTVYIKAPPPEVQNGVLTGYMLEVHHPLSSLLQQAAKYSQRSSPIVKQFPPHAHSLSVRLLSSAAARACVSAGTSKGFSHTRACLEVPRRLDSEVPPAPRAVTVDYVASEHSYTAQWTGSSGHLGYTVFYCWSRVLDSSLLNCTSEAQWETVAPNMTSHIVKSRNIAPPTFDMVNVPFLYFGVASTSDNVSAGIVISHCTYNVEHGRAEAPNFAFQEIKERGVTVIGNGKCSVPFLNSHPLYYEMFYIEIIGNRHQRKCTEGNKTVVSVKDSSGTFEHDLSALNPGGIYNVCMRTVSTYSGRGSDVSLPETVALRQEVNEAEEETNDALFIGLVVPLLLSVLGVVIWLLYGKKKLKQWKKFSPSYRLSETTHESVPSTPMESTVNRMRKAEKGYNPHPPCERTATEASKEANTDAPPLQPQPFGGQPHSDDAAMPESTAGVSRRQGEESDEQSVAQALGDTREDVVPDKAFVSDSDVSSEDSHHSSSLSLDSQHSESLACDLPQGNEANSSTMTPPYVLMADALKELHPVDESDESSTCYSMLETVTENNFQIFGRPAVLESII
ncbi:uncharacterized protein LOC143295363 isoform X2 [Babylonia areolata]|uniref:uncharacterized protein LOC143295363 isoform X2 n=1 Tax=Babylonia areolata TaxID=304850 RepID=UPI003FD1EDBA